MAQRGGSKLKPDSEASAAAAKSIESGCAALRSAAKTTQSHRVKDTWAASVCPGIAAQVKAPFEPNSPGCRCQGAASPSREILGTRMKAKFKRILLPVTMGLLVPLVAVVGCEKDEPPPPLPSAAPKTEPAPDLVLEPEDAGADEDADADAAKKPTGPYKPAASLSACCAALNQNAASAPEPNATYMRQAGATCSAMVASGQGKNTILGAIRGALRGAGLPSACN